MSEQNLDLRWRGRPLDTGPEAFGFLRRSDDCLLDAAALRARMAEDGYLFLPGALDRETVLAARQECLTRLAEAGALEAGTNPADAIAAKSHSSYFRPDLAKENAALSTLR